MEENDQDSGRNTHAHYEKQQIFGMHDAPEYIKQEAADIREHGTDQARRVNKTLIQSTYKVAAVPAKTMSKVEGLSFSLGTLGCRILLF